MAEIVWSKPKPALYLSDCEALRKALYKGDSIRIITNIWDEETHGKREVLVTAEIDGVYPNGVQLVFTHRNWRGIIKCYRWLSYVQMLIDDRNGAISFIDVGGRGANVDRAREDETNEAVF